MPNAVIYGIDGFGHHNATFPWWGVQNMTARQTVGSPRAGAFYANMGENFWNLDTPLDDMYVHLRFRIDANSGGRLINFYTTSGGGRWHIQSEVDASGHLKVYAGIGAVVAADIPSVPVNNVDWYQCCIRAKIHATLGIIQVWTNGSTDPVAEYNGGTIWDGSTTATATSVTIGNSTRGIGGMDFVIADAYLGDARVDYILPAEAGANQSSDSTVGAASRFQAVNEQPADGDTSYNLFTAAGQVDGFKHQEIGNPQVIIKGVVQYGQMRKDDLGTDEGRFNSFFSAARENGATKVLTASHAWYRQQFRTRPDTTEWAPEDFIGTDRVQFEHERIT